jgi:hypothetical protein
LGFPIGPSTPHHPQVFWRHCRGERGFLQGESLTSNLFTLLLFCLVSLLYFCLHLFIKNTKIIVPFIVGILLLYFWFVMLNPEYVLKDLSVGSGSIIGKDNIEEFFNHVSKHKDIKHRSIAELAPSYEIVVAYLFHMLEARFVNLNPIMQQMFVKLHDIEDTEKRNFILETMRKEFRDVVIEARKVFDRLNMLGSCVDVIGTNRDEIKIPIPFELVGMHEALKKNFDLIVPKNPFEESSEPKSVERGSSKAYMDKIQFLVEKTSGIDLDASLHENT